MKKKTIESIVADMSDEEMESFKELIEECLVRERDFIEMDSRLKDDIRRLSAAEQNLLRSINLLSTRSRELQDTIESSMKPTEKDNNPSPPSLFWLH